jgi:hypothetical protein
MKRTDSQVKAPEAVVDPAQGVRLALEKIAEGQKLAAEGIALLATSIEAPSHYASWVGGPGPAFWSDSKRKREIPKMPGALEIAKNRWVISVADFDAELRRRAASNSEARSLKRNGASLATVVRVDEWLTEAGLTPTRRTA